MLALAVFAAGCVPDRRPEPGHTDSAQEEPFTVPAVTTQITVSDTALRAKVIELASVVNSINHHWNVTLSNNNNGRDHRICRMEGASERCTSRPGTFDLATRLISADDDAITFTMQWQLWAGGPARQESVFCTSRYECRGGKIEDGRFTIVLPWPAIERVWRYQLHPSKTLRESSKADRPEPYFDGAVYHGVAAPQEPTMGQVDGIPSSEGLIFSARGKEFVETLDVTTRASCCEATPEYVRNKFKIDEFALYLSNGEQAYDLERTCMEIVAMAAMNRSN
jgi:hypothetical protein